MSTYSRLYDVLSHLSKRPRSAIIDSSHSAGDFAWKGAKVTFALLKQSAEFIPLPFVGLAIEAASKFMEAADVREIFFLVCGVASSTHVHGPGRSNREIGYSYLERTGGFAHGCYAQTTAR